MHLQKQGGKKERKQEKGKKQGKTQDQCRRPEGFLLFVLFGWFLQETGMVGGTSARRHSRRRTRPRIAFTCRYYEGDIEQREKTQKRQKRAREK